MSLQQTTKSTAFMIDNLLSTETAPVQRHMPPKKRMCLDSYSSFSSYMDTQQQQLQHHQYRHPLTKTEPMASNVPSHYALFCHQQQHSTPSLDIKVKMSPLTAQHYVNAFYAAAAYSGGANPQLNSSGYSSSSSSCSSYLESPASASSSCLKLEEELDEEDGEREASFFGDEDEEETSIDVDLSDAEKENTSPCLAAVKRANHRVKKEWSCAVCGKRFDRPSLLQRHVRTHTGEKPHACDLCDKAFSTSSSLNTHRRIHSGEKPHACNLCGKKFTASSNLYYHKLTHTSEKPHKCTKCAKSFSTPGDLRGHMHSHNGTWPFRCEVCSRGFTKQTNMKNHMLTHTGKSFLLLLIFRFESF